NLYELPIDRMLLKSKDRPKADGLPVPSVESTAGLCKQVGNFVTLELSSITCTATDKNGKTYELQYQSDGAPMAVRRIKRMRDGPSRLFLLRAGHVDLNAATVADCMGCGQCRGFEGGAPRIVDAADLDVVGKYRPAQRRLHDFEH